MVEQRLPVLVLAGGKSTRLGRDKASEVLASRSLLQRALDACADVASAFVIVKARGQVLPAVRAAVPVTRVEDAYPETGPLGGIVTGLDAVRRMYTSREPPENAPEAALVIGCDMPLLQAALLRELVRLSAGHEAVVPVHDGLPEPLCAVYAVACADASRRLVEQGAYRVAGLLDAVNGLLVEEEEWRSFDPDGLSFLNVNREEDLKRARAIIGEGA